MSLASQLSDPKWLVLFIFALIIKSVFKIDIKVENFSDVLFTIPITPFFETTPSSISTPSFFPLLIVIKFFENLILFEITFADSNK